MSPVLAQAFRVCFSKNSYIEMYLCQFHKGPSAAEGQLSG